MTQMVSNIFEGKSLDESIDMYWQVSQLAETAMGPIPNWCLDWDPVYPLFSWSNSSVRSDHENIARRKDEYCQRDGYLSSNLTVGPFEIHRANCVDQFQVFHEGRHLGTIPVRNAKCAADVARGALQGLMHLHLLPLAKEAMQHLTIRATIKDVAKIGGYAETFDSLADAENYARRMEDRIDHEARGNALVSISYESNVGTIVVPSFGSKYFVPAAK